MCLRFLSDLIVAFGQSRSCYILYSRYGLKLFLKRICAFIAKKSYSICCNMHTGPPRSVLTTRLQVEMLRSCLDYRTIQSFHHFISITHTAAITMVTYSKNSLRDRLLLAPELDIDRPFKKLTVEQEEDKVCAAVCL